MRIDYLFTVAVAVIGGIMGSLLPTVRPGPTRIESVLIIALIGAVLGYVLDVLRYLAVSIARRDQQEKPRPDENQPGM
jgi:hypothetical protein